MNRYVVLVADDEPILRELTCQILSKQYEVVAAINGKQAVELARKHQPQVMLVDIVMPELDGVGVVRELRNDPTFLNCQFIMMTALNDSIQRTAAFDAGADDYLEKPFKPEELLARVQSKVRRVSEGRAQPVRTLGDLKLDLVKMSLSFGGGTPVRLGPIEVKILNALMGTIDKILTRRELADEVWGAGSDGVIDPHITSIRKKLLGSNLEIRTVYGHGYSIGVVKP